MARPFFRGDGKPSWTRHVAVGATALAIAASSPNAFADEGGVSFWLPGIYWSLAAVPMQPGWTVNETYYHWQGQAGADVSAAREVTIGRFNPTVTLNLSGNLNALADLSLLTALYTFEQPVVGGQATVGLMTVAGRTDASVNATISGTIGPFPFGPFMRSDFGEAVGFGDLYPQATLRWNKGVDNYMLYVTGDVPVGLYSSSSLANIGIGPQVGFIFPIETPFGIKQAYLNVRGYAEFDHQNRAQGFDTWVSLTISNPTPAPPTPPMVHK